MSKSFHFFALVEKADEIKINGLGLQMDGSSLAFAFSGNEYKSHAYTSNWGQDLKMG